MRRRIIYMSVISFLIIAAILLIVFIPFRNKDNNPSSTNSNNEITHHQQQTINDLNWDVSYKDTKKIVSIKTSFTERERTSTYYQELARKHGDSSVFILHIFTLVGTPMEDNWFKIEKTEKLVNGWDNTEVLATFVTRYEEKLIFNLD